MANPPYPCLGEPPNGGCSETPTYPARECTSGAAWWGSVYTGKQWPQGWGNADNWPAAARAAGFVVNATSEPSSVMCLPPWTNGSGPQGHVAFVTGDVQNGKVAVIEMNFLIEYGYDFRSASVASCEFIHLVPKADPTPTPPEDPIDMLYLFNAGVAGIWCLYEGKYFHVTPDDIGAFEALASKPIQTIGAAGHAVLLATYGVTP